MSKLDELKSQISKLIDKIQESEAFQQLKAKYEELDNQTKFRLNLGALGAVLLLIIITIIGGVAKVNGLKSDINQKEELIGYLEQSADTIKQLKAQQSSSRASSDVSSPLNILVESVSQTSGLDKGKLEVSAERPGTEDKETKEFLVDVKMNQINLRQLTRFLFNLTEQGSARKLNIKDLNVDTKGDPSGYLDATVTVAAYKAK